MFTQEQAHYIREGLLKLVEFRRRECLSIARDRLAKMDIIFSGNWDSLKLLIQIDHQAARELRPLVGHVEQLTIEATETLATFVDKAAPQWAPCIDLDLEHSYLIPLNSRPAHTERK